MLANISIYELANVSVAHFSQALTLWCAFGLCAIKCRLLLSLPSVYNLLFKKLVEEDMVKKKKVRAPHNNCTAPQFLYFVEVCVLGDSIKEC